MTKKEFVKNSGSGGKTKVLYDKGETLVNFGMLILVSGFILVCVLSAIKMTY